MTNSIVNSDLTFNGHPIHLIELDEDGHILQIWTDKKCIYLDWCKKYQVHLADTFNGGGDIQLNYWIAPGAEEKVQTAWEKLGIKSEAKQITELPPEVPDWLESAWDIGETPNYCQVCEDYLPREPDCDCKHLWWVNTWGDYGGCGYCEHSDLDKVYYPSMRGLFRWMGRPSVLALREALMKHNYILHPTTRMFARCKAQWCFNEPYKETTPEFGGAYWDNDEIDPEDHPLLEPAIVWMQSLEAGITQKWDWKTVEWIDRWLN
jgi:hypothetical protein